jgi:hypothetical protein
MALKESNKKRTESVKKSATVTSQMHDDKRAQDITRNVYIISIVLVVALVILI